MDRPLTGGRFGFGTPNPPPTPVVPPRPLRLVGPTQFGRDLGRRRLPCPWRGPLDPSCLSDLVELVSVVCRCLIATTGVQSGCHVPEPPGGLLLLLASLPPCLPAYRASCAPATPYICASLPFGIHPNRLPAAPTAATANPFCAIQGKTHLPPSSSLTPTYLSSRFRSVCQHWTTPSPPLPPLWFSPPPPFLAGQVKVLGFGVHLTCNYPSEPWSSRLGTRPYLVQPYQFILSWRSGLRSPVSCPQRLGGFPRCPSRSRRRLDQEPRKTLGWFPRGGIGILALACLGTHKLLAVSTEPVLLSPTRR